MPAVDPGKPNPLIQFVHEFYRDPVRFVQDCLGARPDAIQAEIMREVASGTRRISVRSGHGVGKSTVASWLMIWFLVTRFPSKTVVTAPTSAQLYDALYSELRRWINALPPAVQAMLSVKAERVELSGAPNEGFISFRTSRAEQPEALQGVHSQHVLLIADEASGVPEQVYEAAAGSMSGHSATTLLLGNPVRSSGFFYDTHNRLSSSWKTFRISCEDSPRVSKEYIQEMAVRYGEESNAYRIRVLGEFPRADDDTLIPMELIELAKVREVEPTPSDLSWGLDVARFGSDRSCLAERRGNYLESVRSWRNYDLMQTTGLVHAEFTGRPASRRPVEILVDSIGIGAGVVDRLRELGLPAVGVNVSESPSMQSGCFNLRAELWQKAKEWLAARDCRIPNDEGLIAELAACKYKFSSNGKLMIESKEDAKRRGIPSPDLADAFVLSFAGNAATAAHGWSSGASRRNKPLSRGLKSIV
jgi:phage terminase large subunit